ncbi:sulfate ABC transporter permease subunit CysT [Lysinibacillus capsici]|jgi:sulfate/thiosulfate transport system permease protein|uniref:sulfate ABC transporter permease subunit CysT n=1 Tax=Lysinibacillus TaxID=400634 RepID=UPI000653B922|nr:MULTISPECIES: sulfate ABC transporter permease subunit CysT [Lysinibacillus]KMN38665.1 sulfate ABC transporter permease [Lysinibacillus sp. LK3]MED3876381.1 sulfate ABC transporter permease subunit CysT [Lysinibacillus capsici]MED4553975.1 sulfate ABC transporter permease subunit CysT [Lysinibacillus capsici]OCX59916.1 sulfate ABC transporter permease subunit CysT [Lysinibacillus sp. AR18-8]RDV35987.1 sulfate ABC transporter permease subunit CysT [Lysinibacillus capsici]
MSSLIIPKKSRRIIPGFHLSLGYTMLYVSLLVLLPLSMIFIHTMSLSWSAFIDIITDPRAVASYKVSFSTALIAGLLNVFFGTTIAWVLVRYQFPFKRIIDGLVDLPFALPTAVAGIALTSLYAPNGWIGQFFDFKIAFTPLGIIIALTFIGLPFVVRTVQPVLQNISAEVEEASASLGANRLQTFRKVILPELVPAILTGFSLAFARALGEYGSVVFIAGNMPMKTEITPLIIMTKLEQYDYAGATAIAVVMLVTSFILLFTINLIQWLANRRFVH